MTYHGFMGVFGAARSESPSSADAAGRFRTYAQATFELERALAIARAPVNDGGLRPLRCCCWYAGINSLSARCVRQAADSLRAAPNTPMKP